MSTTLLYVIGAITAIFAYSRLFDSGRCVYSIPVTVFWVFVLIVFDIAVGLLFMYIKHLIGK